MGEFEDAWEDEIEEDEIGEDQDPNGVFLSLVERERRLMDIFVDMEVDEEVMPAIEEEEEEEDNKAPATSAFIPGVHKLGKDEVLEADDTVYEMRHSMQVRWPSLSFDILRDNLGDQRQRYPATAYIAAGTQADLAKDNELAVYKLSSLHRTQKDGGNFFSSLS